MLRSKYNEEGVCIETQVGLIILSPGPLTGAPDPTTEREYRMLCAKCRSFTIYEAPELEEVRCKGCDSTVGILDMTEFNS
jgi:hypothetical protein